MTLTLVLTAQFLVQIAALGGLPREPVFVDPARVTITPLGFEVLTGQGDDPFKLAVNRTSGLLSPQQRGDAIFWRSLETTEVRSLLYGLSWDELYRVNAIDGSSALMGKVEVDDAFRAWFGGPVSIQLGSPAVSQPDRWSLRATVEIPNPDLSSLFAVDVNSGGEIDALRVNAVLVERTVTAPSGASATLLVKLDDDERVNVDLVDITGVDHAFVGGLFTATFPPGGGETPVRLPLAGISRSPAGDLYGLSEGEWDPYGSQGLYAISTNGGQVAAERVADVSGPDLLAIEFLGDSTLLAAGDGLYELDELTGDTTYVGTTGAMVVDLDFAPGGRLYGTTFEESAPSQLIDVTPGGEPLAPYLLLPTGRHWGLAVHRPQYPLAQRRPLSEERSAQ